MYPSLVLFQRFPFMLFRLCSGLPRLVNYLSTVCCKPCLSTLSILLGAFTLLTRAWLSNPDLCRACSDLSLNTLGEFIACAVARDLGQELAEGRFEEWAEFGSFELLF